MMKKRILFFILSCIFYMHSGTCQDVKWGNTFHTPTKNKSVLKCIGNNENTYYFFYDYYNWNFFGSRQDDISIIAVQDGKIVATSKKMDIRQGSLEKIYVQGNQIIIVYSYYNTKEGVYEVIQRSVDARYLTMLDEKVIISFESTKRNVNFIYFEQSPDLSKVMIAYMDVNKKTKQGYLDVTIFDKQFKPISRTQFAPKTQGEMSFIDFNLNDDGEVKIVGISRVFDHKKMEDQRFVVVDIKADEINEVTLPCPQKNALKSVRSLFTTEGQLVIGAVNDDNELLAYSYNMDSKQLLNQFSIPVEKNYAWRIDCLKRLADNSAVIVCEDAYTVQVVSGRGGSDFGFYNRNIRVVCINPEKNIPVYTKMITRASVSGNVAPYSIWEFEKPSYFVKGNTFYALYNTSKNIDNFQEEPIKRARTEFRNNNKKIVSNLAAFHVNGNVSLHTVIAEKEEKARYAPLIAKQVNENEIIITKVSKARYVTIGTLTLP